MVASLAKVFPVRACRLAGFEYVLENTRLSSSKRTFVKKGYV